MQILRGYAQDDIQPTIGVTPEDGYFPKHNEIVRADPARIIVINKMRYENFMHTTNLGVANIAGPYTKELFYAFLHDSGVKGAINTPGGASLTPGEFKYTHNVGATFNAAGVATINKSVFSMTSGNTLPGRNLAQDVARSKAMERLITSTYVANEDVVNAWFLTHPTEVEHTFTFSSADVEAKFVGPDDLDSDFQTAFGDVYTAGVTVTATVSRQWLNGFAYLRTTSAMLGGVMTDLYDFDYDAVDWDDPIDRTFTPARLAASIQAGYGTLGTGGHVYKNEVHLAGTAAQPNAYIFGDSPWAPGDPNQ